MRTARVTTLATMICVLLGAVGTARGAEAGEWPCWRGANHDGKSPDTGLLESWPEGGPAKLWQNDEIGTGFSSVAVSNGLIYTSGDIQGPSGPKLIVSALDMDGKLRWTREIDDGWTRSYPGSRSTPTVDGDRVYVLSGNGVIACLDARTGVAQWARKMSEFGGRPGGWGYAESVLIVGDLAVVKPGGRQCIVALDKTTGRTAWVSPGNGGAPEYGSCIPITFEGKLCIAAGNKNGIVCVDASDGKVLWSNPWCKGNTANCPDPAYADGYVFWANGYGKGGVCLKLKAEGGTVAADQAWTTRDMNCHHGGYVIDQGHIYGNNGGRWACLDLKTGQRKWNSRGVGKGSVCYADGMLYLFSEKNGRAGLAKATPDGFEMTGSFSVEGKGPSWAHPVVIGGRLYLRYDTHLYCFDVTAK
jgi:outer membrane protein assembly factor BamB